MIDRMAVAGFEREDEGRDVALVTEIQGAPVSFRCVIIPADNEKPQNFDSEILDNFYIFL